MDNCLSKAVTQGMHLLILSIALLMCSVRLKIASFVDKSSRNPNCEVLMLLLCVYLINHYCLESQIFQVYFLYQEPL